MKEQVLKNIEVLHKKAKEIKTVNAPANNKKQSRNSLAENITTKEQADLFKKLLKAL